MSDPVERRGGERKSELQARRIELRSLRALAGWAVAIFLFFYLFPAFELVMLSLLGSAILASALRPLAHRIPARRWPSAVLAGLLLMLLVVGAFWLVGWLVWDVAHEQAGRWPQIQANIDQMLAGWSRSLGLGDELSVRALRNRLVATLTRSGGGGGDEMVKAAGAAAAGLVSMVLVLFGATFLLGERKGQLLGPVLALLPGRRAAQVSAALSALDPKLRWWLIGTLTAMTVAGTASGLGFAVIGLQFALPLAVLAGLSELVPTFGPTFAFLVALLVAATQGGDMVAKVLLVWLVVQTLESHLVLPLVMQRAVSVPPLVTLFSVVFWGKVFGVAGLLLAIPLDLVVWTFASHLLRRGDGEQPAAPGRAEAGGGIGGA